MTWPPAKIPAQGSPGITKSDLFVINKTDLAPHVGANLDIMRSDTARMQPVKPWVMTNLKTRRPRRGGALHRDQGAAGWVTVLRRRRWPAR